LPVPPPLLSPASATDGSASPGSPSNRAAAQTNTQVGASASG